MSPTSRRRFLALSAACAVLPSMAMPTAWPVRPVRLLVPGGPGGVTDVRARWLAPRLSAVLGQPVIVENRAGAGGIVAMESAARDAEGHTIVVIHQGTMAVNPALHPKLPYDPLRDFMPLTLFGIGPLALVVPVKSQATTVAELLEMARSRREPLAFGSPGVGTPPHLAGALFCREGAIRATHIPYKSGGHAASDLMAGHVDFSIEGLTLTRPLVQEGRLRALAVTARSRVPFMSGVPTLREAGLANYEFNGWTGFAVHGSVPYGAALKAHAAITEVMRTAEAADYFAAIAADPGVMTPEACAAFIREEQLRIARLVRDAGIRAE
jgi:tripartite-type tricarboxylate transporter receptor subunit TctC